VERMFGRRKPERSEGWSLSKHEWSECFGRRKPERSEGLSLTTQTRLGVEGSFVSDRREDPDLFSGEEKIMSEARDLLFP